MKPDRWRRAQTIFERVIEAPRAERQRILESGCGTDQELLRAVTTLLESDQRTGAIADQAPLEAVYDEIAGEAAERWIGRSLGPYRIVALIGHGGMGQVFRAEREDDVFDKRVAVKIMSASSVLERFHRERQILANLEHPDIARLLDGGTTQDGLPYVVMELVEGVPLTDYCQTAGLGLKERLRLVRRICEAVHYAHGNLVVHRDLKPTNILVTPDGQPKLLDFGIAKLLTPEQHDPVATLLSEGALTPSYASPEQLLGKPVTTASDVFSLGVLLFETLTGARPFARPATTPLELARSLDGEAAPLPSAVVGERFAVSARELRGDVDNIVLKALRSSPAERYGSVERLARDLDNYLADRPVEARTLGYGYRVSKFVRRHALAVAAAFVATVTLGSLGYFHNRRIEAERDVSEQALEFLVGAFESADPEVNRGREVTAREILALSAERLEGDPELSDEVLSVLTYTLGRVQRNLGSFEESRTWLQRSLELAERLEGSAAPELGPLLADLAEALLSTDRYEEAEAVALRALELLPEAEPALRVKALNSLASSYAARADWDASAETHRRALELARAELPESDPQLVLSLNAAVRVARRADDLETAIELNSEALGLQERYRPGDSPTTAMLLASSGHLRFLAEDLERAEELCLAGLEMRRRIYGDSHQWVASSLKRLATIVSRQGRLEEASALFAESLAAFRASLGDSHFQTIGGYYEYARFLHHEMGAPAEAGPYYRQAINSFEAIPGMEAHPNLAALLSGLAGSLAELGRFGEAEPLWRRALDIYGDRPESEEARLGLARSIAAQRESAPAAGTES